MAEAITKREFFDRWFPVELDGQQLPANPGFWIEFAPELVDEYIEKNWESGALPEPCAE